MTEVSRETPLTLEDLNNGWPFGPGPDQWPWYLEMRSATEIQPEGIHVCCAFTPDGTFPCAQSITRIGWWAVSWNGHSEWRGGDVPADGSLKPLIALHVMQVHSEAVTG